MTYAEDYILAKKGYMPPAGSVLEREKNFITEDTNITMEVTEFSYGRISAYLLKISKF